MGRYYTKPLSIANSADYPILESALDFFENTPSDRVPVRKPYFYAYQTLIRKIGNNQGIRRIWPGIYETLLPDTSNVYVKWQASEMFDPASLISGRIRITNINGREILISI